MKAIKVRKVKPINVEKVCNILITKPNNAKWKAISNFLFDPKS